MKILFIDDEFELMVNVCSVLESRYGPNCLIKVKSADDALKVLSDDPMLIDIAVIDQKLEGDISGIQLGAIIAQGYPFIPLVMLTGYADLALCKTAMRAGFSDLWDKSTDIIGVLALESTVERMEKLDSTISKMNMKKELLNKNLLIQRLTDELNKASLSVPFRPKRIRRESPAISKLMMLDNQERVFELDDEPEIAIDANALAIGMLLLERDIKLDGEILKFIKVKKFSEIKAKYSFIPKKPRSTIQMRFDFYDSNQKITDVGIEIVQAITKDPGRWPNTLKRAKRRRPNKMPMETFIDEIVYINFKDTLLF